MICPLCKKQPGSSSVALYACCNLALHDECRECLRGTPFRNFCPSCFTRDPSVSTLPVPSLYRQMNIPPPEYIYNDPYILRGWMRAAGATKGATNCATDTYISLYDTHIWLKGRVFVPERIFMERLNAYLLHLPPGVDSAIARPGGVVGVLISKYAKRKIVVPPVAQPVVVSEFPYVLDAFFKDDKVFVSSRCIMEHISRCNYYLEHIGSEQSILIGNISGFRLNL
jgi:hypothetical protein